MKSKQGTRGDRVVLSKRERAELAAVQRTADVDGISARRARIIELLAKGWRQSDVQLATGAGIATVGRARRRFLQEGLEAAIYGYEAPGAPRLLKPAQEARIVALACSEPPLGRSMWTTQLLAEHAVERGFVDRVGRETVRLVLKHHGIKPWREKNVVRGEAR
jgi:putative transposase